VFASGFDHSTKRYLKVSRDDLYRAEKREGVTFAWLRTLDYRDNDFRRILNMLSYAIQLLRCRNDFSPPDVIIGSSMHPLAPTVAWWMSRKYRVPFLFEIRDLWPQTAVDMGVWSASSVLARSLYAWEKFMCREARKVIVLMPFAGDYLADRGVDRNKVVWVSNGVDIEAFDRNSQRELPDYVANVLQRSKGEFHVLYAGAHGRPNDLDQLLDAANILKKRSSPIRFVLIGDGSEKNRLQQKASALSLDNVLFCPPISKESIAAALCRADCLALCVPESAVYKYGVSLNKLFDYLASGRPVVLAGNLPNDLVREAGAGLSVPPNDPKLLADALMEIQNASSVEREQMGMNGRRYVEQHYSTRHLADILDKLLQEVLLHNPVDSTI